MTLVEPSRESLHVLQNKKRCKKQLRVRRRDPLPPPKPIVHGVLQRLFVSCQDVFRGHGPVPSPDDVSKVCRIIDGMVPEDVGLSRDMHFFNPKNPVKSTRRVTYTTIYQSNNFSMCIFFLPATAVIPLHNHPEMTVFSKLLLGTMHIKSYDWTDPSSPKDALLPSRPRLAKLKADSTFTAPCDTSVLYPTSGGNIHAFTAITSCAVLDVIGPPYSKNDGRDCSYYKETAFSSLSNREIVGEKELESGEHGWLEEIDIPEDSHMDRIEYLGPPIIANFNPNPQKHT